MEAIKATTARRGRRLARASSSRVIFCAAIKGGVLGSLSVSLFRQTVMGPCAAPCARRAHSTTGSLFPQIQDETQCYSAPLFTTRSEPRGFSGHFQHGGNTQERHPLWRIASRLPPGNPESVRIRHNLALVRTQSSTVANSVTLRGTPVVEGTRTRIVCNPLAIRLALRYAISEKPTVTIHIHSSHASQ